MVTASYFSAHLSPNPNENEVFPVVYISSSLSISYPVVRCASLY